MTHDEIAKNLLEGKYCDTCSVPRVLGSGGIIRADGGYVCKTRPEENTCEFWEDKSWISRTDLGWRKI